MLWTSDFRSEAESFRSSVHKLCERPGLKIYIPHHLTSPAILISPSESSNNILQIEYAIMRPIFRRLLLSAKVAAAGGAAGLGSFFIYTRNDKFTAVDESDSIFKIVEQNGWNPHSNPTTHDFYVRRVSLNDIRPELRDSPEELTKAFCAGVWSNWGIVAESFLSMLLIKWLTLPYYL